MLTECTQQNIVPIARLNQLRAGYLVLNMFALLDLAVLINHPVAVSAYTHYLIRILRSVQVDVHSLSQYSPPLLHIGVHHH